MKRYSFKRRAVPSTNEDAAECGSVEASEVATCFEAKFGDLSPDCSPKRWLEGMQYLATQYAEGNEWDRLYIKVALRDLTGKAVEFFPEVEDRTVSFVRRLEAQLEGMDVNCEAAELRAASGSSTSTSSVCGIVCVRDICIR